MKGSRSPSGAFCLFIDFSSVPDFSYLNYQDRVIYFIDYPIISHPNSPQAISAPLQFFASWGTGLHRQFINCCSNCCNRTFGEHL